MFLATLHMTYIAIPMKRVYNSIQPTPVGRHVVEQSCRRRHENRTDEDEQHKGSNSHYQSHSLAQLVSDNLGQRDAPLPDANHATKIVVNGSGKNASKHYPKIGCGAKEDAHDCSENRACTCYVEELYQEHSPSWHWDEVHAISLGVARHLSRSAWTNHSLNNCSVD